MAKKADGSELGLGVHVLDPRCDALLQVFFVADQNVDVLDDAADDLDGLLLAAHTFHSFSRKFEVEAGRGPGLVGCLHAFDDPIRRCLRTAREDAAAVEPTHAAAEDGVPVDIARLHQRGGFVGAVVNTTGARTPCRDRCTRPQCSGRHAVCLKRL